MTSDSSGYRGSNPRQAEARRTRLAGFSEAGASEGGAPPAGVSCDLLCEDHVGTYELPFACVWIDGGWTSEATGDDVAARVVGWRRSRKQSRP